MKRDAKYIQFNLQQTKSDILLTKKESIIQFPKRYEQRGLAQIGSFTQVFGIYCIIMDGRYGVVSIPSMMETSPNRISEVEIDEVPYYNFHYDAGSPIIDNIKVIRKDLLIYNLMEEFILKGNIPWYIQYEDLGVLFNKAKEFADSNAGEDYAVLEAIAAYVSRSNKNRSVQIRHEIKSKKDLESMNPAYIGLYGNVFYAAPDTVSKLAGSYFQDAIVSSLVQPSNKVSHVENLLTA